MSAQPGIYALGTTDHTYLELDLRDGANGSALLAACVGLVATLSTDAGVNVVLGFRPSLWAGLAGRRHVLSGAADWDEDLVGPDGFTMPATQHDTWIWISGGSRTAVFDAGRRAIETVADVATVGTETGGWLYRHDRDLTGFIDGTENPSLVEAPDVVAAPDGAPGAGSTVVLFQLWPHDAARWNAETVQRQEQVIGRTKADSVELDEDVMPADSHVSRTVLEVAGHEQPIFRRNTAFGTVSEHGTAFVGFSYDQWRLAEMLRRMAGVGDGIRCALTRYTRPVTGAYYVCPSVEALQRR